MSSNLENDRSVTTNKMYPIDLAPQKITIVKSVSNTEVKMAHLIPGQPKTSNTGQIIAHATPVGLMRPAAQIISPGVTSQPQMIVSGSPILQGTQIVSQGSQLIGQSSQIISQSQIIPSSQIISPGTQIISQGTQLSAQVSNSNNLNSSQATVSTTASGTQVLNVGGQLAGGTGNLIVSSSVRALPSSVRVLPPLPHHNTRPAMLSSVNVSTASGMLVSAGVTSHVPRGIAAGASLTRPTAPTQSTGAQGWASGARGVRGALVYGARSALPRAAPPRPPSAPPAPLALPLPLPAAPHPPVVTLPTTTVLTSNSVISSAVRASTPRASTPTSTSVTPRPLPLLQRNYQPTKVVGVASVGVRTPVGNSAPAQLYYEVQRPAPPHHALAGAPAPTAAASPAPAPAPAPAPSPAAAPAAAPLDRPTANYAHAHAQPAQVNLVSSVQTLPESRQSAASIPTTPVLPRPSILRKREMDGSPTKTAGVGPPTEGAGGTGGTGWEDVPAGGGAGGGSGGSTTMSASSSPAPDDDLDTPRLDDMSPRKKPRKQMFNSEVRQCDFQAEEAPPTPPPPPPVNPPKRPQLGSSYVCGWRATAMHFPRPADVRARGARGADIVAIANQKHVLTSAEGWKVHHLTAQMDDLVSLEADVGEQLAGVLRTLETTTGRVHAALQPHSHALLELIKGNIQRSKIVCEGIQEAREDILRVFTHRNFVSDILARQADKRCFRKHRSQS